MTTAAAIVIGDEVLSGKVADANGPYLIARLREAGVPLRRILTVSDELDEIAWALASCLGKHAPIFTSGGIGPTHDDKTVAGVALALGRKVVRHPELEREIRVHMGPDVSEEALRLANVPEGATLFRSPRSWYPVITVGEVYLLPGVPQLFRMHVDALAETLRGKPFHLKCVYVTAWETDIAAVLDRVSARHPGVALGSYPRFDEADHKVKLTLEAQDVEAVEAALRDLLEALPAGVVARVE